MEIVILLVAMILVGLLMGWVGGLIWKDNRPIGVGGDYIAAVISAVATEPAGMALIVLWIIRKAKS